MAVWGTALGVLGLGIVEAQTEVRAQEPAPASKPGEKPAEKAVDAAGRRKHDAARRVPAHFGQIGLTTEQRANIYTIQSKRLEAIEALEQQIAREKAEMLVQCESTLTDTQRKLLDNLRRAATDSGTTRTVSTTPPR